MALAVSLSLGATLRAQETTKEAPLQAGSEGVPVPKRSKTVPPTYPPEAQAAGIRGIVILELVVDAQGKVESVNVIRSVPGLDEAAVEAARQWEYEITKVGGKPVSVRLTVPITFAMRLPEVTRQEGIPELRQGAVPAFPEGERGSAEVAAEITIDGDGMVTEIRVVQGEAPWTDAALRALRTWRFSSPADAAPISFRVQAEFIPARGKEAQRVALRLDSVRRSETFASTPTTASAPPPTTRRRRRRSRPRRAERAQRAGSAAFGPGDDSALARRRPADDGPAGAGHGSPRPASDDTSPGQGPAHPGSRPRDASRADSCRPDVASGVEPRTVPRADRVTAGAGSGSSLGSHSSGSSPAGASTACGGAFRTRPDRAPARRGPLGAAPSGARRDREAPRFATWCSRRAACPTSRGAAGPSCPRSRA